LCKIGSGSHAGRGEHFEFRRVDHTASTVPVRRKLVEFDAESWHALDLLARDRDATFQELADEAFRDLLAKHHRPVGLRDALRRSAAGPASARKLRSRKAE
jgi:Antitoxin-like ribbon-helix-helix